MIIKMVVTKYQKKYVVKSYEVDCHGFLRLLSLMNFLQEAAVESAAVLGLGFEECAKRGLAWVGANYLLKIDRFPKMQEAFVIETWPCAAKLWGAVRDFAVKDSDGNVIIKATSQWVLVDAEKHRPVLLKKHFPDYVTLDERILESDFSKMVVPEGTTEELNFKVRFDDIDVNQHVNNAVYPVWASESVESAYRIKHYPVEIELCFKKEALYGEKVRVVTMQKSDESFHTIYEADEGDELAQCRIVWKEITSK